MKILVTGAMGFIGSNLIPLLLNEGHDVVGFDNLFNPSIRPTDRMKKASGENWARFKFYKIDILDATSISAILVNEKIDAIIHLAAVGSVPRSFQHPELSFSSNVMGFINMMRFAAHLKIKRFVYASSSSVYGSNKEKLKVEGEEGNALSPYALTKQMNEQFAMMWAKANGVNSVGLRFFNVYGPGQLVNSPYSAVIPRFINGPPTLYGDGSAVRDYTYVADVACAILKAVYFSTDSGLIANVGTGAGTSLRDLLVYIGKTALVAPKRPGDVAFSIADTQHAEQYLGFKAKVGIKEGLELTRAYYESEANHERASAEAQAGQS